jgi:hypothetical protein
MTKYMNQRVSSLEYVLLIAHRRQLPATISDEQNFMGMVVGNFRPYHLYFLLRLAIKFVSDLRQIGGFLRFPPPIKLTAI